MRQDQRELINNRFEVFLIWLLSLLGAYVTRNVDILNVSQSHSLDIAIRYFFTVLLVGMTITGLFGILHNLFHLEDERETKRKSRQDINRLNKELKGGLIK